MRRCEDFPRTITSAGAGDGLLSRRPARRGGRAVEPVLPVLPVLVWLRRLVPLAIAVSVGASAIVAFGKPSHNGRLTGTWSGYIAGNPGSGVKRHHMRIVVNAGETGGSWRISATCHGPLTLDSISNGYHHYLRKLARGATCAGGDVDCLRRVGADVYDAVTSHIGGQYDSRGTLRHVTA
jgi:hypothetical protein